MHVLLCADICVLGGWTAHVCAGESAVVHTVVQARGHPQVSFFRALSTSFLRQGLPLAWDLPAKLGWLTLEPQESIIPLYFF